MVNLRLSTYFNKRADLSFREFMKDIRVLMDKINKHRRCLFSYVFNMDAVFIIESV